MTRGLALVLLGACGSVATSNVQDAPPALDGGDACLTLSCDDNDPCTVDSCSAGACQHAPAMVTGMQMFTAGSETELVIPACASMMTIDAAGAAGGGATGETFTGGLGAHVVTTIPVSRPNLAVMVMVGSAAPDVSSCGGGGGGSFVWDVTATTMPLVAAGGGGGACFSGNGAPGSDTTSGTAGPGATTGFGTGGTGSVAPTPAVNWAAGGAGWLSNGAGGGGSQVIGGGCSPAVAIGGTMPLGGGAGGNFGGTAGFDGPGGFGGGGGGQGRCGSVGGGGGGGFSGGAGGVEQPAETFNGGGGGGSFGAGTPTITAGAQAGNGAVTISWQ